MDPAILVERDVEIGRQLITALDAVNFRVVAAFWELPADEDEWRLNIASPYVSTEGDYFAYTTIGKVLRSEAIPLSLMRTTALSEYEPLVIGFRLRAPTEGAPFLGGTFYSTNTMGDAYINRAYLYRAERLVPVTGSKDLVVAVRDRAAKVWRTYPAVLTFEKDKVTDLMVEGYSWPSRQSKRGLELRLNVLERVHTKKGKPHGDIYRWTVSGGQLESISRIEFSVPLDAVPAARVAS